MSQNQTNRTQTSETQFERQTLAKPKRAKKIRVPKATTKASKKRKAPEQQNAFVQSRAKKKARSSTQLVNDGLSHENESSLQNLNECQRSPQPPYHLCADVWSLERQEKHQQNQNGDAATSAFAPLLQKWIKGQIISKDCFENYCAKLCDTKDKLQMCFVQLAVYCDHQSSHQNFLNLCGDKVDVKTLQIVTAEHRVVHRLFARIMFEEQKAKLEAQCKKSSNSRTVSKNYVKHMVQRFWHNTSGPFAQILGDTIAFDEFLIQQIIDQAEQCVAGVQVLQCEEFVSLLAEVTQKSKGCYVDAVVRHSKDDNMLLFDNRREAAKRFIKLLANLCARLNYSPLINVFHACTKDTAFLDLTATICQTAVRFDCAHLLGLFIRKDNKNHIFATAQYAIKHFANQCWSFLLQQHTSVFRGRGLELYQTAIKWSNAEYLKSEMINTWQTFVPPNQRLNFVKALLQVNDDTLKSFMLEARVCKTRASVVSENKKTMGQEDIVKPDNLVDGKSSANGHTRQKSVTEKTCIFEMDCIEDVRSLLTAVPRHQHILYQFAVRVNRKLLFGDLRCSTKSITQMSNNERKAYKTQEAHRSYVLRQMVLCELRNANWHRAKFLMQNMANTRQFLLANYFDMSLELCQSATIGVAESSLEQHHILALRLEEFRSQHTDRPFFDFWQRNGQFFCLAVHCGRTDLVSMCFGKGTLQCTETSLRKIAMLVNEKMQLCAKMGKSQMVTHLKQLCVKNKIF